MHNCETHHITSCALRRSPLFNWSKKCLFIRLLFLMTCLLFCHHQQQHNIIISKLWYVSPKEYVANKLFIDIFQPPQSIDVKELSGDWNSVGERKKKSVLLKISYANMTQILCFVFCIDGCDGDCRFDWISFDSSPNNGGCDWNEHRRIANKVLGFE